MKPNFENMNKTELRRYVLEHRDDMEVIRVLFRTPSDVEIKRYPSMFTDDGEPIEENIIIAEKAINQRIEEEKRDN